MNPEKFKEKARHLKERWWTRKNQAILVCAVIAFGLATVGWVLVRSIMHRGWPQTTGTLALKGLSAPVTVVRDRHGVPHIYAENEFDLFFAQGFVHAQDRFWGMEQSRRRGRGTLSAVLGEGALATDQGWRNLNLVAIAQRELAEMDAKERALLDAYAEGVNAWLETPGRLPFEFTLLSWRGLASDDPTPWTVEDSLIVSLVLRWQIGAPRVDPYLATRITERVGSERGAFLLDGEPGDIESVFKGLSFTVPDEETPTETPAPLPERWALGGRVTLVPGSRTESRESLLAVDLPTDLGLPAPWYVMAWHAGDGGDVGASVPGLPGLVLGMDGGAGWREWSTAQDVTSGAGSPTWMQRLLAASLTAGEFVRLDQAPGTLAGFQEYLMDTRSERAAQMIPFLVRVEAQGWRQERVTGMLRKWDYRIGDNNKEAPFFAVYQLELARAAFADDLGDDIFEAFVAQSDLYQSALDQIIQDPDDEWWDDVTTPERELRSDIMRRAYEPTLEWIGRNYGDLHMLWEWDIVHGGRLHHPLGDVWPWDQLLNHALTPDGWADTVNASPGGLPCLDGVCFGGDQFRVKAVYGYRQTLDASDPSVLYFTLLPGQSGHPFHAHYDDLLDEWLGGEYTPVRLVSSPEQVNGAEGVLVLKPKD